MRLVVILLSAIALAGCLGGLVEPAATDATAAEEVLRWTGGRLVGRDPPPHEQASVLGRCLALLQCDVPEVSCEPRNCARYEIEVPAGSDGALVAGLRWPSVDPVWHALWIEDGSGAVVAQGRSITIDHNGASAVLDDPAPGRYHVVVAAVWGSSEHEVAARFVPRAPGPAAPRALLPDLVVLPPTDLRFADPPGHFVANAVVLPTNDVARAMGSRYCSTDEAMSGARRCLRFSNAVGNVGEGPLDIALLPLDAATHAAGGRFVQRVTWSDGRVEEMPAGAAEWHAIHAHWHNAGTNVFTVHAYDPATGERGEPLREGRKTGMCYADVGVIDPAFPGLALPDHQGAPCFNPLVTKEWRMGLSVGWYDSYTWVLGDQYVDVDGLEDGTYQLCSAANLEAHLAELDDANNAACTAFRLEGDSVETLDPLPYHAAPRA